MASALNADQELAAQEFLQTVNRSVSRSTAIKFLFARKFDVARAVSLYEQHEATRKREGLDGLDPSSEPLKSELETGKFTILQERDTKGAAIAVFTARLHRPEICLHRTTLAGVVHQLDAATDDAATQKYGLVFVYDMTDSKYANFDYDLSQKMLMLLKGGYPARLKRVLIVTAPLWFRAPFRVLRLFVREKLRDRVHAVAAGQLAALHGLPGHVLRRNGDSSGAEEDRRHGDWLTECLARRERRRKEDAIATQPAEDVLLALENKNVTENGLDPQGEHRVLDQQRVAHVDGAAQGALAAAGDEGHAQDDEEGAVSSSASSGFSDDDSLAPGGGVTDVDAMTLSQLANSIRERGRQGLIQEYAEIRARPPDGSFAHARSKTNVSKNRYTDVLCYDHSRVALNTSNNADGNDCTSDYINANFVDGYKQRNAYISTQGPLPKTVFDFWRMIWEQHCLVIVMTTRVAERGRTKCHQYWPALCGESQQHGIYLVTAEHITEEKRGYTVTDLTLTDTKTGEQRTVSHWQFTAWPDYGVPDSAATMLDFLEGVRIRQRDMLDKSVGLAVAPPIVVHCSAGIGRTGTFCTLDICISRLEDIGTVDVRGTVERIRAQRAHSIQMPDQYVFCHLALIEYGRRSGLLSPSEVAGLVNDGIEDSD